MCNVVVLFCQVGVALTDLSHGFELRLSILLAICIVWVGMV